MTIHLHCLIPLKTGHLMIPGYRLHDAMTTAHTQLQAFFHSFRMEQLVILAISIHSSFQW